MNLEKTLNKKLAPIEETITEKDCMLYALGIGLGQDPLDEKQLQFVYEKGLQVFPTMSVVVAHPGPWLREPALEVNYLKLLHGEQAIIQHAPLVAGKCYIGQYRVLGVVDKGADKGAIIYQEKTLTDKASGALVSTVTSSHFLRDDGGCGDSGYQPAPPPPARPQDQAPDKVAQIETPPTSALLYRLSGDYNPLHADPEIAAQAGFERPILHGLCTFGIAARAILDCYGASRPQSLASMGLRFSAPVYPGEMVEVHMWDMGDHIQFTASVPQRGVKVLDKGHAVCH